MRSIMSSSKARTKTAEPGLELMLEKAAEFHGHLCPGTVIGTRMALVGMAEIDITDPKGSQKKDFMVYIETDRCPVDAISVVTGARISRRNLKFLDWGKVAATFVNLKSNKAVRITCPDSTRDIADNYADGEYGDDKDGRKAKEVDAYKVMPEKELFIIRNVKVEITPFSKEKFKVKCDSCGETVNDHKEIVIAGKIMCRPCGEGKNYYKDKSTG